ncbi:5-deoxy-glucuronate isomerase [Pleomorphomonas diazotrophica]|uniref:5-deoxy-glucuronate isomerase n=1 Tax=Pleomorphomonas diazotrophica TaxID=1166257 RepID=A0A1I4S7D6_9HYPH|nr:5-deoxy-glucuronate isomerase [Pleomorphomonas diazotrophica]PKR89907.1 5-deoxy-glucuronate isomerase [Pleomorphomonas diazotrophica]SFM60180.1 5-deoxyglucuronate isomerase [Pleomorphomonas diazotrophica]
MPNSHLRVRPKADRGLVSEVTPESAGWTYVGFALHRLESGKALKAETGKLEVCLVLVSGKIRLSIDGKDQGEIGERMSPFEGAPWAAFIPPGGNYELTATTEAEVAICSAPGAAGFPAKLIPPGTHPQITRGKGSNTRLVTNIMPENDGSAHSLLVVEVITPGGNTSSYPPHKHDQDDIPAESHLEETYYHRFNPPQGYGFQRVYTDDRSLDEVVLLEDGDVVMVPKGYHPVATIHGYDNYYLNVMAGPKRIWKFHNEPAHEWLFTGLGAPTAAR